MAFSIAVFFSGRDEPQSVENMHNVRGRRVVEFNVPFSTRSSIVDAGGSGWGWAMSVVNFGHLSVVS